MDPKSKMVSGMGRCGREQRAGQKPRLVITDTGRTGTQRPSPAGGVSRGLVVAGAAGDAGPGVAACRVAQTGPAAQAAELAQSIRLISDELEQSLNLSGSLD